MSDTIKEQVEQMIQILENQNDPKKLKILENLFTNFAGMALYRRQQVKFANDSEMVDSYRYSFSKKANSAIDWANYLEKMD